MHNERASAVWTRLDGDATFLLDRIERYAQLTIPTLFLPDDWNDDTYELNLDYQSVGAQLVNHLTNKMMLALFAPSRPFFRMDPSDEVLSQAAKVGADEQAVQETLSVGERKAVKAMDSLALRPKLYQQIKLLIVTGNCLTIYNRKKKSVRVVSVKYWRVKRNSEGQMHTLVIKECIKRDELEQSVQNLLMARSMMTKEDRRTVDHYRVITRTPTGRYRMEQWVDDFLLPDDEYGGNWSEKDCPYRVSTWDLADESDYGTGLVENYSGAFEAVSALSRARIEAAILASEFRWLANPGGMTRPEDFKNTKNGECLPGVEGDLFLVQAAAEVAQAIQVQTAVITDYVNQLGRAFLLSSAVTRDAERVTAEEIRMVAQELETGLGGAYSRIAIDVQEPLAYFLLEMVDLKVKGEGITPVVVTGLDALSRNGDLENLKLFLQDVAELKSLPPQVLATMDVDRIIRDMATARGLPAAKYVKAEAQVKREQKEAMQQSVDAQAAVDANAAQAQAAAQQGVA
jgi:hypothetical protein